MKATFFLSLSLFLLLSCNNNKEEKAIAKPALNDSASQEEKFSSSLEKDFPDTTETKAVHDPVFLKFNFQEGKTYSYSMASDVTQKVEEKSRQTTMKWNCDMLVTDKANDLITIKTTYRKIEATMDMGTGSKLEFSSEKEIDVMDFMQLPSRMFNLIKGKSFTMQVNEKGKIVSVTGFDKLGEEVINEMNLPAEMKPMMQQNFRSRFGDDAVRQMFTQAFNVFPNKYVKSGDTWRTSETLNALKQDVVTVYTVKDIKGGRVYLSGDSKLKSLDGKSVGTQKSKLIIDASTGLIIDGVIDQKSSNGQNSLKNRIAGKAF
jgi:hypothetical protein